MILTNFSQRHEGSGIALIDAVGRNNSAPLGGDDDYDGRGTPSVLEGPELPASQGRSEGSVEEQRDRILGGKTRLNKVTRIQKRLCNSCCHVSIFYLTTLVR